MEAGISPTMRMSRFSAAYIAAIAAAAGCDWTEVNVDEDGVDGTLCRSGQHRLCHSPNLAIQLKSTMNSRDAGDSINYDLKVTNYEHLIVTGRHIPALLAVLPVPRIEAEWIRYEAGHMALHHRAYWVDLAGHPETRNRATIVIPLPKSQALDAAGLIALMNRVSPDGRLT